MSDSKDNSHRFQGTLDHYDHPSVFIGWARLISDDPSCRVEVALFVDGDEVARASACHKRTDLEFLGDGYYGFEVRCERDIPLGSIASERVCLKPVFRGVVGPPLSVNPKIVSEDKIAGALAVVAESALTDRSLYRSALEQLEGNVDADIHSVLSSLTGDADFQKNFAPKSPKWFSDNDPNLTTILIRAGLMSRDGSAVLGKDGHAFLIGGTNNFIKQWELEIGSDELVQLTKSWIDLIRRRQEQCEKLGIKFVQAIIQEKLSALSGYFEYQPDTMSPLLRSVSETIGHDASLHSVCTLHPRSSLDAIQKEALFRKTDSHLTPYGTFELFKEIVRSIGTEIAEDVLFSEILTVSGDLSERFIDVPLLEQVFLAPEASLAFLGGAVEVVDQFIPEGGGHVGRWQRCFNKSARDDKTVLVFGNSFSSFIEGGQPALSWWLSRWFKHYHFHWQAAVDWELVQRIRPDILISQTNERFMRSVPPH